MLIQILKIFALGGFAGFLVSVLTIIMIKKLAKRADHYEMTYVPMTLVESKLWKCVLIVYPLLFASAFAFVCALKLFKD
jgi:hypothetical protein